MQIGDLSKMVFVFGSSISGRHLKGSALIAHRYYGAISGRGIGLSGDSYAIPVQNVFHRDLTYKEIETHVAVFLEYAKQNKQTKFVITKLNDGTDNIDEKYIEKLFRRAPTNCRLPYQWRRRTDF